jgi:hypothetical protein
MATAALRDGRLEVRLRVAKSSGQIMAYEYDIFFSYKRDRQSDAWHLKLKQKLEYWVSQELTDGDVRIFFDIEEIKTGDLWKQTIASALRRSKCILCIWSRRYFRSDHCRSEWQSFEKRSADLGMSLVIPTTISEDKDFPNDAQGRQSRDLSSYFSTFAVFWESPRALELEDQLRILAKDIARVIKASPEQSDNFPIVELYAAAAAAPAARPRIERPADG